MATEAMIKIKLRFKSLNARGNWAQITRRLRLPDGHHGWASDLAEDVEGSWSSGTYLASERHASQSGRVPIGTIVLEFESPFRNGQKSGSAQVTAGFLLDKPDENGKHLKWGLSTRKQGLNYQVKTTEGEWVDV